MILCVLFHLVWIIKCSVNIHPAETCHSWTNPNKWISPIGGLSHGLALKGLTNRHPESSHLGHPIYSKGTVCIVTYKLLPLPSLRGCFVSISLAWCEGQNAKLRQKKPFHFHPKNFLKEEGVLTKCGHVGLYITVLQTWKECFLSLSVLHLLERSW